MIKLEEKLPEINQIIIAYCPDGSWYLSRYQKELTWKGYKYKFVNLTSKMRLWHDDVIGWNRVPTRTDTI